MKNIIKAIKKLQYEDISAITFFISLIAFVLIMSSCTDREENPIVGTENWVGERMNTAVEFYDTQKELNRRT